MPQACCESLLGKTMDSTGFKRNLWLTVINSINVARNLAPFVGSQIRTYGKCDRCVSIPPTCDTNTAYFSRPGRQGAADGRVDHRGYPEAILKTYDCDLAFLRASGSLFDFYSAVLTFVKKLVTTLSAMKKSRPLKPTR